MTGATMNFAVDAAGLDVVLEHWQALDGADKRGLLDEIGRLMAESAQNRFEMGKGPGGVAWKPSRRAASSGGQTMVDTGLLRDTLTHRVVSDDTVEVGSNVQYAAIHQFGGVIKAKSAKGLRFFVGDDLVIVNSVTMPARPFLGIDDGDADEIQGIITDHLMSISGGAA